MSDFVYSSSEYNLECGNVGIPQSCRSYTAQVQKEINKKQEKKTNKEQNNTEKKYKNIRKKKEL